MQSDLLKLASQLRESAQRDREEKFVKSAQVVRGLTALAMLARKLGRQS